LRYSVISRSSSEGRRRSGGFKVRVCHGGFDLYAGLVGVLVFEVISMIRREASREIEENVLIRREKREEGRRRKSEIEFSSQSCNFLRYTL
jgi:hypothetical protein